MGVIKKAVLIMTLADSDLQASSLLMELIQLIFQLRTAVIDLEQLTKTRAKPLVIIIIKRAILQINALSYINQKLVLVLTNFTLMIGIKKAQKVRILDQIPYINYLV